MTREILTIDATATYEVDAFETVRGDYGCYQMPVPEYRYSYDTLKVDIQYENQEEFDELMGDALECYFGGEGYDHAEYDITDRETVQNNPYATYGYAQIL